MWVFAFRAPDSFSTENLHSQACPDLRLAAELKHGFAQLPVHHFLKILNHIQL
jgi:hypothetical protein